MLQCRLTSPYDIRNQAMVTVLDKELVTPAIFATWSAAEKTSRVGKYIRVADVSYTQTQHQAPRRCLE